jgi:Fe2+ or Zn2+ uptake regulation protein
MIFNQPHYNSIFTHLSRQKDLSVQDLYALVSADSPISLSQFYKVIDQLLSKQMLVKE